MKKIAIVYYTMSGNTEYIAKHVSEIVDVDLIRIIPKKVYPDKGFKKFFWGGMSATMGETPELEPYEFDSNKYDMIIIATPVWASTFAPPIKTFIKDNKEKISGKEFAVIVSFSGGGADKTIEKLKKFLEIDSFKAELVLIDPKEKVSEENNNKINDFCKALDA